MQRKDTRSTPTRIRCTRCKKVKGRTKFSSDASRPSGHFPWCMDCQVNHAKAHRFQDENAPLNGHICPVDDVPVRGNGNRRFCSSRCKEKTQALRRKFNLTVEQYRALVDATDGRCPICQKQPTEWHVDHNHKTGKVMGVVCSACNVGALASTYHDPEFVRRLLAFLEESPTDQLGIDVCAPEGPTQPSQLHRRWQFGARKAA